MGCWWFNWFHTLPLSLSLSLSDDDSLYLSVVGGSCGGPIRAVVSWWWFRLELWWVGGGPIWFAGGLIGLLVVQLVPYPSPLSLSLSDDDSLYLSVVGGSCGGSIGLLGGLIFGFSGGGVELVVVVSNWWFDWVV